VPSRTAVAAFNTHREKNGKPIVFRNVGILGTGPTGRAIAHRVVSSGVPVLLANTRGPLSMAALCSTLGPLARAVSVGHAALADAVVLALPFVRVPELAEVVDDWTGRIVIDSTNQFATYTPRYSGYVDLGEETGSEWVARQLPGATVIKAFNTLTADHIRADPYPPAGRRVVFFAGDDAGACSQFAEFLDVLQYAPVYMGPLRDGGALMQLGGPLSALHVLQQP
jgi:predicted dinucleotide-binding enzyme